MPQSLRHSNSSSSFKVALKTFFSQPRPMCVCVCACVRACVCVCVCGVTVKRPALPPCAVDGRSRNPLYFYYWFFHPFVRPFVLPPFHPFLKPFLFPLVPQPMRFSSGIPLKLSQFQLTLAATEPRNCLLGSEHRNKKPQESLCLPRADSCRSRFEWVYSV